MPRGDSEGRFVHLCSPEQSTAPISARYLCTKARQLRRAPAPPRTYQLFHNQGGKLQVIVSSDKETLQMPGPEGPGQLRFLPPPSDRQNSRLTRGQRLLHDSSPQRLTLCASSAPLPEPGTPIPRSGEAADPRHRAPGAPTRAGGRHTRPRPGGKRRRAGRGRAGDG